MHVSHLSTFRFSQKTECDLKGLHNSLLFKGEREAHLGISKDIYKSSKGQKHLQVCQQLLSHPRNLCRYAAGNV